MENEYTSLFLRHKGEEEMPRRIVSLHEEPAWKEKASTWFHEKWDVPQEEYINSREECIRGEQAVPQWYILPYQ